MSMDMVKNGFPPSIDRVEHCSRQSVEPNYSVANFHAGVSVA